MWIKILASLTVFGLISSQNLPSIRNRGPIQAQLGQITYLSRSDLRIRSSSAYCRVQVLEPDNGVVIGRLTPTEFPCTFRRNSVQYEHYGLPVHTKATVRLLILHGNRADEAAVLPVSLAVEIIPSQARIISSQPEVTVANLRDYSTSISTLNLIYETANLDCTVSLLDSLSPWPRFGHIANVTSAVVGIECEEFLKSDIKYRHSSVQSPKIDYIQGHVTLTDKMSGEAEHKEWFTIRVHIEDGVENKPPQFDEYALLQLVVPQFILTVIPPAVLNAEDDFTPNTELVFAVDESQAQYPGKIVSTDDQTLEIFTFTLQDVSNLKIAYLPPNQDSDVDRVIRIRLYVVDAFGTKSNTYELVAEIQPRDTNAPIVTLKNALTLTEGDSVVLSPSTELNVADEDTPLDRVTFSVVQGLRHGSLSVTSTGEGEMFTGADLQAGLVRYTHDHSDSLTDNVIFQVSDGENQIEFLFPIIIFPVDDSAPILTTNTGLRLHEGTVSQISRIHLRATDADSSDTDIVYVMGTPPPRFGIMLIQQLNPSDQRGWTQVSGNLWEKAVSQWTQTDIDNGYLHYKQSVNLDEALIADSLDDLLSFQLRDSNTPPNLAGAEQFHIEIIARDTFAPTLLEGMTLHMTVEEGSTTPLSPERIFYTDNRDKPKRVYYEINDIYTEDGSAPGQLVYTNNRISVHMFSQLDINQGRISYMTADGEFGLTPRVAHVSFTVSDSSRNVLPDQKLTIFQSPMNNVPPQVHSSIISLYEFGYTVVTPAILDAQDPDTRDEDITFTLAKAPTAAQLKIQGTAANEGDKFSKSDIQEGRIVFVSTGGDVTTDTMKIEVSDGVHHIPIWIEVRYQIVDEGGPELGEGDALIVKLEVPEGGVAYLSPDVITGESGDDVPTFRVTVPPIRGTVSPNEFTMDDVVNRRVTYTVSADEIGSGAVRDKINITVASGQLVNGEETTPDIHIDITIQPVDNKAPVMMLGSSYTVDEGSSAPIMTSHLSVVDVDSQPLYVICTIVNETKYGFLELSSPALGSEVPRTGLEISSFTMRDLNQGHVHYKQSVHQGQEPHRDEFTLSCSDGVNQDDSPIVFPIVIDPTRDESPQIFVNNFVVEEGNALQIDTPILNVIDRDQPPDLIQLKVLRKPVHGMIMQSTLAGIMEITEFNFDDVRYSSTVAYVHDGTETTNDSFSLQATDGKFTSQKEIPIRILPVDDEMPQIVLNKGLYVEAEIGGHEWSYITKKVLKAEDLDSVNENITYKIRQQPVFGFLQRRIDSMGQYWDNVTRHMTFQQWELDNSFIRYVHSGRYGVRDVVKLDLSDTARNILIDQRFHITVEPLDRVYPEVVNRGVQLPQSHSVILTTDMLNAWDDKSSPESLVFTVTEQPKQGVLELVTQPDEQLDRFTQIDLAAGRVRYTHQSSRGRVLTDSFSFEVTDGWNPVARAFTITLNPVDNEYPVLAVQPIRLREKGSAYITPSQLLAIDEDTPPENVVFTIKQVPMFGEVLLSGSLTSMFTADDLQNGRVQYKHSGEESMEGITIEDSFSIVVSDGVHNQFYAHPELSRPTRRPVKVPILIASVDDYVPQLVVNQPATALRYDAEKDKLVFQFTPRHLKIEDLDTGPQHIMFWVVDRPQSGKLVKSDGRVTNSFTQADINRGDIVYELNDGEDGTTDQFTFRVQDSGGNAVSAMLFTLSWSYVSIRDVAVTFNETQGDGAIVIQRTGNTATSAYVSMKVADVTTMIGDDYRSYYIRTIQFNPGEYEKTWNLPILDDSKFEQKEMLTVELQNPVNTALRRRQEWITVSIVDPEDTPIVSIDEPSEGIQVQENVGRASIQLMRTGDLSQEVVAVCNFETDGSTKGTNHPALYTDFILRSSAVRFVSGQSLALCYVDINDDTYIEPDESFSVFLERVEGGVIGVNSRSQVTILADPNDLPVIRFTAAEYQVSEGAGSLNVEVKRTGSDLDVDSVVIVLTQRIGERQAEPRTDYLPVSRSLQFQPGEMMKQVKLRILDDRVMPMVEGRETFGLILRFPDNASLGSPNTTVISINDETDVPEFAFTQSQYSVSETNQSLTVTISRYGDLASTQIVRCIAQPLTARSGTDFLAPRNQRITFGPGDLDKVCTIVILDDDIYEGEEKFRLQIQLLSSDQSESATPSPSLPAFVTILDEEDRPTLRFADTHVYVSEPETRGEVTKARVVVLRDGDVSQASSVRIYTREGTAKSGIDYIDVTDQLDFGPGIRERQITIDVLYDDNPELRESILVLMMSDSNGIAQIGLARTSVYISDENSLTGLVFPVDPVVISLKSYNIKMTESSMEDPTNGYPLICVTPCDSRHPSFARTRQICADEGIENELTQYRWKVGVSIGRDGSAPDLQPVVSDTFMTSTTSQILDSLYFGAGSRVQCLATASSNSVYQGVERESHIVTVSLVQGVCKPQRFGFHGGDPYLSKVKYLGSDHKKYPHHIKLTVSIPHRDGMLPAISTEQLSNFDFMLSPDASRIGLHRCSNLVTNDESPLEIGWKDQTRKTDEAFLPYQHDGEIRGETAVSFYSNLDLENCVWEFTGYFKLHELISTCGTEVETNGQVEDLTKSYVSVVIPIYVSYVFHSVASPGAWRHYDLSSKQRLTFVYDTAQLLRQGVSNVQADGQVQPITSDLVGRLYLQSVKILPTGHMRVQFQTIARFYGQFILKRGSAYSQVTSDARSKLNFDLELLVSEATYNNPEQIWQFTSNNAINDYTGRYVITLLPCIAPSSRSYSKPIVCATHASLTFNLDIELQQVSDPVAEIFSLNTELTLTRDKRSWLNQDSTNESLPDVSFLAGEKIYGKVSTHELQNDGQYPEEISIEKVFVCTGRDGFVPKYDPESQEYGCVADSGKLSAQYKILDGSNPEEEVKSLAGIPFNARLARHDDSGRRIYEVPGMDGFYFDSEPLLENGQQWFVHVIYSVDDVNDPLRLMRYKRAAGDLSGVGNARGTNMAFLFLEEELPPPVADTVKTGASEYSWAIAVGVVCALLLIVTIGIFVVAKKITNQSRGKKRDGSLQRPTRGPESVPFPVNEESSPMEPCEATNIHIGEDVGSSEA